MNYFPRECKFLFKSQIEKENSKIIADSPNIERVINRRSRINERRHRHRFAYRFAAFRQEKERERERR